MISPMTGMLDAYNAFLDRMQDMKSVKPEVISLEPTACVDCGTWGGCVCAKPDTIPPTCYVCAHEVAMNKVMARPVVCADCKRTYL